MAQKFDYVNVIDVEATCWEGPAPACQVHEIIEIGLARLDLVTLAITPAPAWFVRPEASTVSAFCTQLTSITPDQVAEAMPFAEACRILQAEHGSAQRIFASWGDYDRRIFQSQCARLDVPYPFGATHLNVKTFFAVVHGLGRELSVARALAQIGQPFQGRPHRGADDAANIATLLAHCLRRLRVLD